MVSISGSDKQVVHLIGIDLYDHRNEHTPLISLLPYSLKKTFQACAGPSPVLGQCQPPQTCFMACVKHCTLVVSQSELFRIESYAF